MPDPIEASVADKAKVEPNTGPMQGVQPKVRTGFETKASTEKQSKSNGI